MLNILPSDYIEYIPSWEASSCSVSQYISHIYGTQRFLIRPLKLIASSRYMTLYKFSKFKNKRTKCELEYTACEEACCGNMWVLLVEGQCSSFCFCRQRQKYVKYYLPWAIQTGTNCKFLMNVYYEHRWEQPIKELHQELHIKMLEVPKS
jgi:hypothetical protein